MDQSTRIPWSQDCLRDLRWWLHLPRLSQGASHGWGAHLGLLTASGLWSQEESQLPINARELLAVRRGLLHFQSSLVGKTVSVFCNNSTAVAYLRKEGGTRSPFLNSLAQGILRWSESLSLRLAPQFIPGSECSSGHSVPPSPAASYRVVPQSGGLSVFMSLVAGPNRLVCYLRESPMLNLFLSLPGSSSGGHGRVPPVLGWSSSLRVSTMVHYSQGSGKAQGISGYRAHLGGSVLAPADLVSRPLHLSLAPPVALPVRPDLLRLPRSLSLYQGLHRLHLHAWRLSGTSRVQPDSLPR